MTKTYLVIVESPGKIKKLKTILGTDYEIIASMGHVVDLPPKSFGINLTTMQPDYVVLKADVAKRIRAEAKKTYKTIFLASDPDREGEAISYHIASLIKRANAQAVMQRVTFDAITPSAVKAAFNSPRTLDNHLVAAQETRRLLDRMVGFPASRFLWQFVQGKGLSAGRVQSVALRLVVERDQAIAAFVPEEYWTISGLFKAKAGEFTAKLTKWQGKKPALKNQADAEAVLTALRGLPFHIQDVTPKQRQQKPPAPFITSSLQQAASSHLKMSPDTTMKLAQQLYEGGYITYMRTDSPAVSPEGQAMARATITQLYGDHYIGSSRYAAKGNSQEAHECVRPTDTNVSPQSLRMTLGKDGERAAAVYELIYKRFLASQMANAVFNEVLVNVAGGAAIFSAKGSQLAFDGFLRVYGYTEEQETTKREDDEDEETATNKQLPPLAVNEAVQPIKLTPQQHFTKPPVAYTEALLIKSLEQNGVGRPSTYAQTVATIKQRGYVESLNRKLAATALGKEVHQVLSTKLLGLFETTFTAQMESSLDEIASGKQNGREYLQQFWTQVSPLFGQQVIAATLAPAAISTPAAKATRAKRTSARKTTRSPRKAAAAPVAINSEYGACPQCGKALVKRKSARGEFLGCSSFPKCRFTRSLP
ncbi:MAG: type I DNA topoisomerase [Chloroflexi bacterium]|nr:type I DNA topoisomerase [Chloroflexota bacterium]MCC6894607.1 type I DNA topoisomerase [Anaerolineae bacterium]